MKVLLDNRYKEKADYNSLKQIFKTLEMIEGEDDGFLSNDVFSPYRYYVLNRIKKELIERDLFYNNLVVPEFWAINPDGLNGKIDNEDNREATIYFKEPIEFRNVKRVEWQDEEGTIYKKDYYDKFGLKYFSEYIDRDGKIESKVYYSDINQEVLVEYPQNEMIYLYENGNIMKQFNSYFEFVKESLIERGLK